jgi:hypothetical protein
MCPQQPLVLPEQQALVSLHAVQTQKTTGQAEAEPAGLCMIYPESPRKKAGGDPPSPRPPHWLTGAPGAQKPCEQQPAGMASLSTCTSWERINAWSPGEKTDY